MPESNRIFFCGFPPLEARTQMHCLENSYAIEFSTYKPDGLFLHGDTSSHILSHLILWVWYCWDFFIFEWVPQPPRLIPDVQRGLWGWAGLNSRENGRRSTEVTELWILGDLIKSLILPVKPRCFVLSSSVCFRLASALQISFSAHNGVSQGLPRTWIGYKMAILQLWLSKYPFQECIKN